MKVNIDASALRRTKPHEYLIRFVLGGLVTAVAGLIARRFGPVLGGLFLAFPAIFPASATLVEKHERQRKEQHGLKGDQRGRSAAAVDAAGAALGSIGLVAFGMVIWWLAPRLSPWIALICAGVVWATLSCVAWVVRKKS